MDMMMVEISYSEVKMGKIKTYAIIIVIILVIGTPFMMLIRNGSQPSQGGGSDDSMDDHHGNSVPAASTQSLKVGDSAPDFNLESVSGERVKLGDYNGKNLVIFLTEGSMCYPSCWDQMLALATDKRFNNDDNSVISIVVDSKQEWEGIIAKKAPRLSVAEILLDTDKKVSLEYGALFMESSMHKGSFPGHSYFIIDKEGIVRYIFDDPQMRINNEALAKELETL